MSTNIGAATYQEALSRFERGLCPNCGVLMEKRERSGDYYCHQKNRECRRAWTLDQVLALRGTLPDFLVRKQQGDPPRKMRIPSVSWFRRLVHF